MEAGLRQQQCFFVCFERPYGRYGRSCGEWIAPVCVSVSFVFFGPASSSCYRGLLSINDLLLTRVTLQTYFFGLQQNRRRSSGRMKCGKRRKSGKTETALHCRAGLRVGGSRPWQWSREQSIQLSGIVCAIACFDR